MGVATVELRPSEKLCSPLLPTSLRIREFRQETHDTFSLTFQASAGFRFQPGQFNVLYAFGVGEAAISISGDPADVQTITHTIRAVGSVTNALAKLQSGEPIGIRGPFGSAWPLNAARGHDVMIVAGGLGLAPLRPVIYHLLHRRGDYGRIALLFGARTPTDILYADELEQWRKRGDIQVLVTVNHGDPTWRGPVGFVTAIFPQLEFDPKRSLALMCGPEVMMRFLQREFEKCGVTDERTYLSLERNTQCAVGFCGHCQFGPEFVCMDGPVFRYDRIKLFFSVPET